MSKGLEANLNTPTGQNLNNLNKNNKCNGLSFNTLIYEFIMILFHWSPLEDAR